MAKQKVSTQSKILSFVTAAVLVVLVVLLFTPFWSWTVKEKTGVASVNDYVWFPGDQKDLVKWFQAETGAKPVINDIVLCPILMLIAGVVGAVLLVLKPGSKIVPVLPVVAGVSAVVGFLTTAELQLGANWWLQVAVGAIAAILGIVSLVFKLIELKKEWSA